MTQILDAQTPDVDQINAGVRYTMYSVFRRPTSGLADAATIEQGVATAVGDRDLVTRGWYDVGGFRADADLMVWWHAPDTDTMQDAYHALRRSGLASVWSQIGVHRPAEFNRSHVPAFLAGEDAGDYLCVYPFVRSHEWYLLPDDERREMLREHGMLARPYADVRANTVASFGLGDYEWLLAFEAAAPVRILDLMRDLRAAAARRHTREEIPFYTGRRRDLSEITRLWG